MKPPWIVLSFGILLSPAVFAQASAPPPAFASAAVHASAPGTREEGGFLPDGRFECRGETLLQLIAMAWGIDTDHVIGGPDWLAADRFDIVAKAQSGRSSTAALRKMLQSLLAERFELIIHEERKGTPVYFLRVAKTGLRLEAVESADAPNCSPDKDADPGINHRVCRSYSMADLSRYLPRIAHNYVDRPVVDATNLAGRYDFRLDWMSRPEYLAAKADPTAPRPISLFDCLENLGLALEPGTAPRRAIAIAGATRLPAETSRAAEPKTAPPRFDVAEVLPAKPSAQQQLKALPSGQLEIRGYTLRDLIRMAFEVKDDRVRGGPKWIDEERFDVVAKSPDVMSPHALSGMVKTLLAERFNLRTHTESEPVPVYALAQSAKSAKLKRASADERSECNVKLVPKGRQYTCRNTTMAQLVDRLPNVTQAYLNHPLVDMTELTGAYDFTLTWTPKSRLPRVSLRNADPGQPPQAVFQGSEHGGGVTIFDAVEKQLGLKIEERTHPMPVIVIDQAERIS